MAGTAEQGRATSSETTPIRNPQPMRHIIASVSGGTRKPKAKEPELYQGERQKLRGWLAQLIGYYRTVGWQNRHDEENILYATSLLWDDAGPLDHTLHSRMNHPNMEPLGRIQSRIRKRIWGDRRQGRSKNQTEKDETRQMISHRILEQIPPRG